MKTLVIITTYNRRHYLAELVPMLFGDERHIWIVDDGTQPRWKIPRAWSRHATHHYEAHHGRLDYGMLVAKYHRKAAMSGYDRVAMIPDDVLPAVDDPFLEAERVWSELQALDPRAIILNMLVDRRGHIQQWRAGWPVHVTPSAWLTQWNDLCFYTTPEVLQKAPNRYPKPHAAIMGSGVGSRFSWALREHGNLYQVDRTIWHHREGESVMCPDERRANPL